MIRGIQNQWLSGGDMSSRRVHFTATALNSNGYIVIAGGTADGMNALNTVDTYNTEDGCYNLSTMSVARVGHAAVLLYNSDNVLVMGGRGQLQQILQSTEKIPGNNTEESLNLEKKRVFLKGAVLSNGSVVVVSGQSPVLGVKTIELYDGSDAGFQSITARHPILQNLVGHSVTSLGGHNSALIFGGVSNNTYSKKAFIFNGADGRLSPINVTEDLKERANHQATYLPSLDAVLISGGDNGKKAYRSCFLYNINSRTFSLVGKMRSPRTRHRACRFANDSVLLIAGAAHVTNGKPDGILCSVERYDPRGHKFKPIASLIVPRYSHEAVVAFRDKIFVFGGYDACGNILQKIEYLLAEHQVIRNEGLFRVR